MKRRPRCGRQLAFAKSLRVDFPAFHVLTPFPGTEIWDEANEKGWLEITDFDYFDLSTPVMGTEHMTREEVELGLIELSKGYIGPTWFARGLLSRWSYRRDMYLWWLQVSARIGLESLRNRVNPFRSDQYFRLVKPDWYDS